jgi:hypothetical protein
MFHDFVSSLLARYERAKRFDDSLISFGNHAIHTQLLFIYLYQTDEDL